MADADANANANAATQQDAQPAKGQGRRKRAASTANGVEEKLTAGSPAGSLMSSDADGATEETTTARAEVAKGDRSKAASTNGTATGASTRGRRKAANGSGASLAGSNLPPFLAITDAAYLESDDSDDGNIDGPTGKADTSAIDDLDATERFDLGETLGRGSMRGGSLVDLLDEVVDTLSLDELDEPIAPGKVVRPVSARHTSVRVTTSNGATSDTELDEITVLDMAGTDKEFDEKEPDLIELARVDDVAEADKPEELERDIDRALTMEGVSVDDSVRIYLREIGRTSLLKSTDESKLAESMAKGRQAAAELAAMRSNKDEAEHAKGAEIAATPEIETKIRELLVIKQTGDDAKQRLVQANLRLVVSIARRYIGRGLSLLDLVQEGNIGLMKAADKFDHAKGFKFSTYATWWIRQAITRAISDQSRTIRLPVHVTEMVTKLRRAAHELQQQLLREPTEEELGRELGMPAERVRRILDMARHPASLDAPMEEGEDSFLGDFIEDETTGAPEEEASRQMLKEQVEDILSKLTERERKILEMRYGLADDRPRTLEEVAREFNITRERIRQIETRILRKLRYARYGASKLKGYLDY